MYKRQEEIRAAEDADLTYRLRAAGWEVERREAASVVHLSRPSVRGFVRQRMIHGAGGAWLQHSYPGSVPPKRWPGLLWWSVRTAAKGLFRGAVKRDRDEVIQGLFGPLENLSYDYAKTIR